MDNNCKILVVEDEIFVAIEIEYVISELGHEPIGIAADRAAALELGHRADVALVDLNLRDGATGINIGRELARRHDVTVLFMTANPSQLGDGVPGTLGVISKPVADSELRAAIRYAVACHTEHMDAEPPARLQLFMTADNASARRAHG
ncbi:response regulator [Aliihoeflea sp. 40Bstr573]|uniref:response regulator n=1 Tax=Aliihoeflea sp. 40Bstr573 TaxID=2696467 RepID=UPI00209475A9|nr:response regulator [Aliihoeflea sp. 40Bstr573]MCO6387301.1 response regulator [Aliihoeflea sp. 40Bstr573]